MPSQIQIELTNPQLAFMQDPHKFAAFVAGVGSGKSFIGSHWAKNKLATEPKARGFIGANTYNQLRNATLTTFFQTLEQFDIPYKYNMQRNLITAAGREIYAYSLENFETIRGIEIGWFWIDESRDTKEAAFKMLLGRLRDKHAKKLEGRVTTSPFGFNWLHDHFAGEKKTNDFGLVQGSSYDNIFLPPDYLATLQGSYDEKMFQQEVLGHFISIAIGQVYYNFKRATHVRACVYNPNYPLLVGMDFNINPMTAVIFQAYDNQIFVLDEAWLMSSDTQEMGMHLVDKHGQRLRIIPDSTGNAKKTSQVKGRTDHQILRDLGLEVIYNHNPPRFDRYVCVNNLLEKQRLWIDPKCQHLITDMEKIVFKKGTTEPDTGTDKTLTHISDALGYGAWFCYPLVKYTTGVSSFDR